MFKEIKDKLEIFLMKLETKNSDFDKTRHLSIEKFREIKKSMCTFNGSLDTAE
jgi:hypothetical protein